MSDFVEQCRLEWRRLGVPDSLAEEMAADLAADLTEAEAEGVSAEEFLGSSPRSFAASWAAERGIIPAPPSRENARRRQPVLVAFTALAAIVLIVTALLLLTGQPKMALVATRTTGAHVQAPSGAPFVPLGTRRQVLPLGNPSAPVEWILLSFAIVALGFAAWLWSSRGRSRPPSVLA
jgi:cytochrome c-type biogenesis protein CcmH/NrfG